MATDVITIGNRISQLDSSKKFYPLSKVKFTLNKEGRTVQYGNDTGREIDANNPFANGLPPVASRWFSQSLFGLSYQPYSADGALLDPAAEIGDAASMSGVYGGIYNRKVTFSPLMKAHIEAPADEEINHEYQFETEQEREFSRTASDLRASISINAEAIALEVATREAADQSILSVTATEIAAKVSKQSPTGQTSFSWSLTDSAHVWKRNGSEVMRIDGNGLTVKGNGEFSGKITASSGQIGGFTISASAIYNGISSFNADASSGVYLGTNGLRLGNSFRVGTDGIVKARDIELTGSITFKNNDGTTAGTLSTGYVFSGAGGGYRFNQARSYSTPSDAFYSRSIGCFGALSVYSSGSLTTYGSFYCNGNFVKNGTDYHLCVATIDGTNIHYLGTD